MLDNNNRGLMYVLGRLSNLTVLNFRFNQIKELPHELGALHGGALKEMELAGNPLTSPPADICAGGCDSILLWLKKQGILSHYIYLLFLFK